ncbi:MAG TPA: ABC transporter permease [Bryobacteraceae bacterium]|nr:ABC transporter permease [Bryobacteraceae bacterium]
MPWRLPGRWFLQNLVERRSLLFQLVRRDFEQRFVGSAIGWIWGLIHPLVMLLSWTFVFHYCFKQPSPDGSPYPLFLFAGMLPWLLFSETLQRSAASLLDHANLITKTVFPSEIIPVSVFLSSLVSHLLALTLMLVGSVLYLQRLSVFVVILPLYVFVIGLLAVGLGWIVAGLHVFLRDTAQFLSVILTFWFWTTPIFLQRQDFPDWAKPVLKFNPLVYAVEAYRGLLLYTRMPSLRGLAVLSVCGFATFVIGGLFFRHLKRGFADVL